MKTLIYVTLESSEVPEEVYLEGKRSDYTYEKIVQILHKKYGKGKWLTFTYEKHGGNEYFSSETMNVHNDKGKTVIPEVKWTDRTFSKDDLEHAFLAGIKKTIDPNNASGFTLWFSNYLKHKNQ